MPGRNKVGVTDVIECDGVGAANHNEEDLMTKACLAEVFGTILTWLSVIIILATFPITVWSCVKIVREYERAVIFRLGRVVNGQPKGPGLFYVIPWLDVIQRVDLRTVSFNIPPQEVLTADFVPLRVDAVMFYRVAEPVLWVTRVADGYLAVHTLAQITLRSMLGMHTLVDILSQRKGVAQRMEDVLYAGSCGWGILVEKVELKDVTLPASLQRSMATEAEAVREARAKMIAAEGEVKASRALERAGSNMSPVALQLRYLQSLSSAANDASTLVCPFPRELLDAFMTSHL